MEDKENLQMIEDILSETKEIYNRNYENVDKVDSKLVQFFSLITALLLLFINLIKFPETCLLIGAYLLTAGLLIGSLILIIRAYIPTQYLAIEPNQLINEYDRGKYKSRKELIKAIAGTTAENVISLKEKIKKKSKTIKLCAYLSVVALLLIIILKITQGI